MRPFLVVGRLHPRDSPMLSQCFSCLRESFCFPMTLDSFLVCWAWFWHSVDIVFRGSFVVAAGWWWEGIGGVGGGGYRLQLAGESHVC